MVKLGYKLMSEEHGPKALVRNLVVAEEAGFDFAVTEECVRFEECGAYAEVFGDAVIDIEYTDDLSAPFDEICASSDRPTTTILRDRNLVAENEPGYAFEHC